MFDCTMWEFRSGLSQPNAVAVLYFFLGKNELTSIPTEIGLLKDLEVFWSCKLNVSNQIIATMVHTLNCYELSHKITPSLISQSSDQNQISSLPSEFGLLTNLEAVSLSKLLE